MIKEFEIDKVYTNESYEEDIMVLGLEEEYPGIYALAIIWVDRETQESTNHDELVINEEDFKYWNEVDYEDEEE